jgi:hypothetical protein
MIIASLLAANVCLLGGTAIDVSNYKSPTDNVIELTVTLKSTRGRIIIYSPGSENKQVRFSSRRSNALLSLSAPTLCIKALGGPFEFDMQIRPISPLNAPKIRIGCEQPCVDKAR